MARISSTTTAGILLIAALAGCATRPQLPPPPTTAEIVQMAKDGQPADAIIERLKASLGVYPLPASELARLREQGVPDKVIDYMQQTYVDAARYQEWLRARDWGYYPGFGPGWPYGYRRPYW